MKKLLTFLLICSVVSPAIAIPVGKVPVLMKGTKGALPKALSSTVIERMVENAVVHSALNVRPFQIANLPGKPIVQVDLVGKLASGLVTTVKILPRSYLFENIFIRPQQSNKLEVFSPEDVSVNQANLLYRGMMLKNMAEVKNLLANGLEVDKCRSHKDKGIFISSDPLRALRYAAPLEIQPYQNLPVFVKIPLVTDLRPYVSRSYGEIFIIKKDIPAPFLLDVWVLLDVNGKPDWCKAVLKDGKLTFIPGYGKVQSISPVALVKAFSF